MLKIIGLCVVLSLSVSCRDDDNKHMGVAPVPVDPVTNPGGGNGGPGGGKGGHGKHAVANHPYFSQLIQRPVCYYGVQDVSSYVFTGQRTEFLIGHLWQGPKKTVEVRMLIDLESMLFKFSERITRFGFKQTFNYESKITSQYFVRPNALIIRDLGIIRVAPNGDMIFQKKDSQGQGIVIRESFRPFTTQGERLNPKVFCP